jgi:hypothetical protein
LFIEKVIGPCERGGFFFLLARITAGGVKAGDFFGDERVPGGVEVILLNIARFAVPDYGCLGAAAFFGFRVEGLVDVAYEVEEEFDGFLVLGVVQGGIGESGGLGMLEGWKGRKLSGLTILRMALTTHPSRPAQSRL